jgi:hypothetical protein
MINDTGCHRNGTAEMRAVEIDMLLARMNLVLDRIAIEDDHIATAQMQLVIREYKILFGDN